MRISSRWGRVFRLLFLFSNVVCGVPGSPRRCATAALLSIHALPHGHQNLSTQRAVNTAALDAYAAGDQAVQLALAAADGDWKQPGNLVARRLVHRGLAAMETLVASTGRSGRFCVGDAVSIADVFLVPQVAAASRFGLDAAALYPTLTRISDACNDLKPFRAAAPEQCPDHPSNVERTKQPV